MALFNLVSVQFLKEGTYPFSLISLNFSEKSAVVSLIIASQITYYYFTVNSIVVNRAFKSIFYHFSIILEIFSD